VTAATIWIWVCGSGWNFQHLKWRLDWTHCGVWSVQSVRSVRRVWSVAS